MLVNWIIYHSISIRLSFWHKKKIYQNSNIKYGKYIYIQFLSPYNLRNINWSANEAANMNENILKFLRRRKLLKCQNLSILRFKVLSILTLEKSKNLTLEIHYSADEPIVTVFKNTVLIKSFRGHLKCISFTVKLTYLMYTRTQKKSCVTENVCPGVYNLIVSNGESNIVC